MDSSTDSDDDYHHESPAAIPVDDYVIPDNTQHVFHDAYVLSDGQIVNLSLLRSLHPSYHRMGVMQSIGKTPKKVLVCAHYGNYTVISYLHSHVRVYHVMYGRLWLRVSGACVGYSRSVFTGEFIRMLQQMPIEDLGDIDLRIKTHLLEVAIGRNLQLLRVISCIATMQNTPYHETYESVLADYKNVPPPTRELYRMRGVDIVKQYGLVLKDAN